MNNMTARGLARRIIAQRAEDVTRYVSEARVHYGDELVDVAISYISAMLAKMQEVSK